jgi:hypothetical protein
MVGSPETSVLNQRMLRNFPEDGRIYFVVFYVGFR